MKKLICSFLVVLVLTFSFPFSAYATDYGDYCSDSLIYPTANLPTFSDSDARYIVLIYNSNDDTFYLLVFYTFNSVITFDYLSVGSNDYLEATFRGELQTYSYNPTNNQNWNYIDRWRPSSVSTQNLLIPLSTVNKFKFLYTSTDVVFRANLVSGFTDYTVTNSNSNLGSTDIYANYFNLITGAYNDNDPAFSGGGGGSDPDEPLVDLTQTNSILTMIYNKLDDVADDVADIKTALASLTTINSNVSDIKTLLTNIRTDLSTINTSIATAATSIVNSVSNGFSGLQTFLTGKYEVLYNVILYGNKEGVIEEDNYENLEHMEQGLNDVTQNMVDAESIVNSGGNSVAAYVQTFSDFYTNLVALNYGLSGILVFGLAVIFIKKVIGR